MPHTWRSAFVKQAEADYAMFLLLKDQLLGGEPGLRCHCLHYLQMSTEKLAKGVTSEMEGGQRPPRVHDAFSKFTWAVKRSRKLQRECQCGTPQQFKQYLDSLLPLANQIEDLAPVGSVDQPNPEYPWEEKGDILTPVEYRFSDDLDFKRPKMIKMLQFISACFRVFGSDAG